MKKLKLKKMAVLKLTQDGNAFAGGLFTVTCPPEQPSATCVSRENTCACTNYSPCANSVWLPGCV